MRTCVVLQEYSVVVFETIWNRELSAEHDLLSVFAMQVYTLHFVGVLGSLVHSNAVGPMRLGGRPFSPEIVTF